MESTTDDRRVTPLPPLPFPDDLEEVTTAELVLDEVVVVGLVVVVVDDDGVLLEVDEEGVARDGVRKGVVDVELETR
jgi:hypothetical protein